MSVFLFIIGFVGILVSLILLIINAIKKKPKKQSLISLGVCFVLLVAGVAMTPTSNDVELREKSQEGVGEKVVSAENTSELESQLSEDKVEKDEDTQKEEETKKETEEPEEKKEELEKTIEKEVKETLSQKNAVRKANDYLKIMAFSKGGLVEQLEYEGFSNEDATYAVNKINVDWNEQAVSKAKSYLDIMPYSRSGLIEQLEYEGFSNEEATYAVDEIGL